MVLIDCCENYVVMASIRTIVIYNIKENKFKTIKLLEPKSESKSEVSLEKKEDKNVNIQNIAISQNFHILAVTTACKSMYIYEFNNDEKDVSLLQNYEIHRGSSALCFNEDNNILLMADKTGDVYECKSENDWKPTLILGHLSMLLGVKISSRNEYIITCDRDEKIRVSSYPDTFNIQSYCLGHAEFVSGLGFLPQDNDILLSCSGDSTLKCWFYQTGLELLSVKLPHPITYMKLCEISDNKTHIALLLYESNNVHIYEISVNNNSKRLESRKVQEIECTASPSGCSFGSKSLWIVVADIKNVLIEYKYDNNQYIKQDFNCAKELQEIFVLEEDSNIFISTLFKSKFHNVEDYHERKKLRLELKKTTAQSVS